MAMGPLLGVGMKVIDSCGFPVQGGLKVGDDYKSHVWGGMKESIRMLPERRL